MNKIEFNRNKMNRNLAASTVFIIFTDFINVFRESISE